MPNQNKQFILWFKEVGIGDILKVGGKNASLGEMYQKLTKKGINILNGFCVTVSAYKYFLKKAGILPKLKKIMKDLDVRKRNLHDVGAKARQTVLKARLPKELEKAILWAYRKLSQEYKTENVDVAVRSSGVAEDALTMSFAGQFETFLNVSGEENLLKAIKKCLASAFTDRVIAYREEKGISHLKFALSVGIQKMVRSDLASSGVIFTLDTETGFRNVVLINSIYGVGEMIVKGKITPDEFYVFKPTLKQGFKPIIIKNLGRKTKKYIFAKTGLKEVNVPKKDQEKFSLTDDEVLTLAKWAMVIEEHYGRAQDIEWAKDGETGQLFIVQSRPETVFAPRVGRFYEEYRLKTDKKPILTGISVGNKVSQGKVKIISDVSQISQFQKGEVLVTKMTDPDWVPALRMASAVITNEGGRTCFTGDTKILTNQGYLSIKKITEILQKEDIKVLSLNPKTLKLEWKKIVGGMKRKAAVIMINISQTGRMKNNFLKVTPDHGFLTFYNRELVAQEIQKLLKDKGYILSCQQIPPIANRELTNLTPKLSYFLGGIITDGHVYLSRTHGEVQFIQKKVSEKFKFIERMKQYLKDLFNYTFHQSQEIISEGVIRDKKITGRSTRYRCYSKNIAEYLLQQKRKLLSRLLIAPEEILYNFLAGVIDGDGTYNQNEHKINIFCSKPELFQAITIACLRLGISFQVSPNRTTNNIQIIDKIDEILRYTSRVKGKYERLKFGIRFFASKQLFEDIIEKVNYKGRIKPCIKNNYLIDAEKIRNYIVPLVKGSLINHQLTKIISSPLKMLRVKLKKSLGEKEVYNIEVEDNHNYLVFTNRYTPVVVMNCHAAIVSRELGIPAVVGTGQATKILKNGKEVTVDCTGKTGNVFLGKIPFEIKRYDLKKIPKLKTKIMINIGAPEIAFKTSFLPNDGVGLARIEFILAEKIRIHPLALYHYKKLKAKNQKLIKKIEELTVGYKNKKEYFIDELAEGISQIASAFWPKPVIVRLSDLKTNEYRALIGGELFEPEEANPMLGWRGASRYYDPKFQPAFEMECQAIKKARDIFGLKNIWVMVPFCRTPEEGKKVVEVMKEYGLERGKNGLKVYVMCEIPSNVILAKEFAFIFDGFSIGSNDLTQLTLGVDRDSELVSHVFDERNQAVKSLIDQVIKTAHKYKRKVGICGQAPSDFPDFAKFLVELGIDSISLNPDTVLKTTLDILKTEKKLKA